VNDDEAREMLEGGPGRPVGHVADVPEGQGPYAFGGPWSGIAKLVEELGELQTILGKLLGVGGSTAHWQGDLRPRLIEEMADVQAAIIHVEDHVLTADERHAMSNRRLHKGLLFSSWHAQGKRNRDAADIVWGGGDP
jgi:hypothetical protein